jgi:hypothetical protein
MKTTLAPTFKSIFKGHEALEIRIKSKSGMSGWFFGKGSGPDIIKLVEEHDGKAEAIYVTLNPINTSALTRTGQQTSQLTTDKDISRRAFILIDVDPVRPADMSSTDEEKEQAYQLILRIKDHLEGIGFPPPHFADSGNGYHLLFPCNMENSEESKQLVRSFLNELAKQFNTAWAKVDTVVYNAARIVKLYGTIAKKGEDTAATPHRRSALISTGSHDELVTPEMLRDFLPIEAPVAIQVKKKPTESVGNRKYVLSALDDAIQKIQNAPSGERNNTLNSQAFSIAQFVGAGELNEHLAWSSLSEAAEHNGLDTQEIDATLHSAFQKGKMQPRHAPEVKQRAVAPVVAHNETIDEDTGEIIQGGDSVDWYSPLPDVNGKGKPLSTIQNIAAAAHRLGVTIRYNIIKKKREIIIPNQSFSMDNEAEAAFAWFTSSCKKLELSSADLDAYTWYIADSNIYNPVTTWVTSKSWDGRSRLNEFYNTVTAENQDSDAKVKSLKEAMMSKWLLSAVAAAFEPNGASTAGVLVFTGAQYMGKTKWFKSLAPKTLDVIKDGLSLRPDDRDSVKRAVSYWMVELGELDATFRKADIAALKAFITSDRDVMRLSYGREERTFARRTVFFGSVNDDQFLKDKTGNRRFWTINCKAIDCDHKIDMQQLWAEVYESMYLKGMSWFLSNDEVTALNEHNDNHTEIDPIDERLSFRLEWKTDESNWRWVTATQMLMECGIDRPTSSDTKTAGLFLRKMNVQKRKSSGKSLVFVPPALRIGQF